LSTNNNKGYLQQTMLLSLCLLHSFFTALLYKCQHIFYIQ